MLTTRRSLEMTEERWDWTLGDVGRVLISTLGDDRDMPDVVNGGRSEDVLEMADKGWREVRGLRLMVELTEVCLTAPVGGRSSLGSVVDEVAVEAAE